MVGLRGLNYVKFLAQCTVEVEGLTFSKGSFMMHVLIDWRLVVASLFPSALCGTWSLLTSFNFKAAYLC